MSGPSPTLASKLARSLRDLRLLPRVFSLAWAATRPWTLAWIGLILLEGLLPVAVVYLTRWVVDALAAGIGAPGTADSLVLPLALLVAVLALQAALQALSRWVRSAQAERLADHLSGLLQAKATTVDLAHFEHPEFYDRFYRASNESLDRSLGLLESAGSLVRTVLTLVSMLAILATYAWWLPPLLFCSTLPAFLIVLRYAVAQHRLWLRTTADQRRGSYYQWVMTTDLAAPEIRVFGLGPAFRAAYAAVRAVVRGERLRLESRHALAVFGGGLLALGTAGAALLILLLRALRGAYSLGDLALFYQVFTRSQGAAESLVGEVGQIYRNSLYLGTLFEFLAIEPSIRAPAEPLPLPAAPQKGLSFREVSFTYPGARRPALESFSLEIPAGRTTAIVGTNGAGKSTLLKLLCRFYDPDAGSVAVDEIDLRSLDPAAWRAILSVLFQQPFHYQASVLENITCGKGDLRSEDTRARAARAAAAAGADSIVARLPHGYDSRLGKWFAEGSELSTGEWQRIALARAFYRDAPILLLDEPTSAMDPWEEGAWLERFQAHARGRTAVIITHRLTTARRADRICVLDRGRLAEEGTHAELLAAGGFYARAWAQRAG